MSEQRLKQRAIVVPALGRIKEANLVIEPTVANLLIDAMSVVGTEILRFKYKVAGGKGLELNEARVLQGYIKSLTDLSKETREREDEMDLASASDDELITMIENLRAKKEIKV